MNELSVPVSKENHLATFTKSNVMPFLYHMMMRDEHWNSLMVILGISRLFSHLEMSVYDFIVIKGMKMWFYDAFFLYPLIL